MRKKINYILIYLLIGVFMVPLNTVYAAYDPHYLLPDYEFIDWQSMDYHQIQDFLLRRNSSLVEYVDPVIRQTPAQVIFDAAMVYQINPKVLLVLLQKEQSLVEDFRPTKDQYDWATGFAVCDSCSKSDPGIQQYRGFAAQVDRAAWRLRYYLNHPEEFRFKTGKSYTIDNNEVLMSNDATRALYTYTPHLHGNENFVSIWQRWFAREYPDGAVLRDRDTKELWLIQRGVRRKFISNAVALSRVNLETVLPASSTDLDKYELGEPIKFAEFALLRSPRGTVYLYANDMKRGIASREVFKMLGFNPEEVDEVTWDDLNAIPDGLAITAKSSYPTGALLQEKSGGIWYARDGVKHALISPELLARFQGKKITKADAAQLAQLETGSPLQLPDGTLVKREHAADVAVIANGKRRPFALWDAFVELGYRADNILVISDKVWDMHEEGEIINIEKSQDQISNDQ